MLYLPHSLAGEFCAWVKALLMSPARNKPKNVQNNHDSAPLILFNLSFFRSLRFLNGNQLEHIPYGAFSKVYVKIAEIYRSRQIM